jgi:hypothetical protein
LELINDRAYILAKESRKSMIMGGERASSCGAVYLNIGLQKLRAWIVTAGRRANVV